MGDLLRGLLLRGLGDSLRTTSDFLDGNGAGLVDLRELLDDLLPELESESADARSGDFLAVGLFFCKLGDLLSGLGNLLLGLIGLLGLCGLGDLFCGLGDLLRTTGDRLRGLGDLLRGLGDRLRGLGGDLLRRTGDCLRGLCDLLRGLGDRLRTVGDLQNKRKVANRTRMLHK